MATFKGKYEFSYGGVTFSATEFTEEPNQEQEELRTWDGKRITGSEKYNHIVTVMLPDIAPGDLSGILPSNHVPDAGTLSTGETVTDPDGAMEFLDGGCEATKTPDDLIIKSCDDTAIVRRYPNFVASLQGFDTNENWSQASIKFYVADGFTSTAQIYSDGAIA